ncbi:S-adenosyl-L-methionine-dependent methyltransferase [Talaromyces proteolyticus]|uniref:S-adenosyl-L-methionine-dependent methyltransferase n=1 Tax=Talaromyces proteolyticus TaxID=1131652 RepID=A0AAD4PZA8_9EURO|nr:S-adenosyl-L-methionine-dependent methyltransferase [Talaromyces proteolyticus]KAH8702425.1 S-adenosyl-L-methionine-dependent methyltransferase [Talaromyces proteolyticus]
MTEPDAPPTFQDRILGLIQPGILLPWALKHYAIVVYETIFYRRQPLAPLLRSKEIRDEAFSRFWVEFSVPPNEDDTQAVPDISTLTGSAALIPPLLAKARGVVLDMGPGTGSQMPYFAAQPSPNNNISAIYGAEPCVGLHAELRRRATINGLDGKYHIVPASAEKAELLSALQKQGVQTDNAGGEPGQIFDTIVCIRVLCSVPNPERTIADLYSLLRSGGQIIVVEHVVNPFPWQKGASAIARVSQLLFTLLGWSYFVGDCRLDRDTMSYLCKAADQDGGWGKVELEQRFLWSAMPYIAGTLTKRL